MVEGAGMPGNYGANVPNPNTRANLPPVKNTFTTTEVKPVERMVKPNTWIIDVAKIEKINSSSENYDINALKDPKKNLLHFIAQNAKRFQSEGKRFSPIGLPPGMEFIKWSNGDYGLQIDPSRYEDHQYSNSGRLPALEQLDEVLQQVASGKYVSRVAFDINYTAEKIQKTEPQAESTLEELAQANEPTIDINFAQITQGLLDQKLIKPNQKPYIAGAQSPRDYPQELRNIATLARMSTAEFVARCFADQPHVSLVFESKDRQYDIVISLMTPVLPPPTETNAVKKRYLSNERIVSTQNSSLQEGKVELKNYDKPLTNLIVEVRFEKTLPKQDEAADKDPRGDNLYNTVYGIRQSVQRAQMATY